MDSSITFSTITLFMIFTGVLNILIPLLKKKKHSRTKLASMVITSIFYLLSIVILGTLYVENGLTSFTLFGLGGFYIKFHLEALGIIFLSLIGCLWPIAIVYTDMYLKQINHPHPKLVFAFISLCIIITTLIGLSANLITMFIFYEMLTLCTIPLIFNGNFYDLEQYLKPLLYSAILLFLPAILLVNNIADSTDFVSQGIIEPHPIIGSTLILLFIFGIAKAALVPVHTWLKSAMVAIVPVSALLHAVAVVKAGLFCIFKIIVYIFGIKYLHSLFSDFNFILLIPGFTIIYSGIKAFKETQVKNILAYSTINQLATALLGVFLFSKSGLLGGVMQMLAHSAAKITAFFAVGNIYILTGISDVTKMQSLYYRMPVTIILFTISLISLCGMPFLAGYVSKGFLFSALYESNNAIGIIIFFIGVILTLLYSGRIIYIFFSKPSYKQKIIKERKRIIVPNIIAASTIIIFPFVSFVVEKFIDFIQ